MSVLPDASTRWTPAGAVILSAAPTWAIRAPCMTTLAFSMTAEPSPGITRAPTISSDAGCACGPAETRTATAAASGHGALRTVRRIISRGASADWGKLDWMRSERALTLLLALAGTAMIVAAVRYVHQNGAGSNDAEEAGGSERMTIRFYKDPTPVQPFSAVDLEGRPVSSSAF